jgi:hypothetical protein
MEREPELVFGPFRVDLRNERLWRDTEALVRPSRRRGATPIVRPLTI